MQTDLSEARWQDFTNGHSMPCNMADALAAIADVRPDAPAIILARRGKRGGPRAYESLTFRRFREVSERYAQGLREYGLQRGDTVLILMKPMLDLVLVFSALWKIGAVPVVVDPGASRQQKLEAIQEIGPKALIGIPIAHILRFVYPKVFSTISHPVTAGHGWFTSGPTLRSFLQAPYTGAVASAPTITDDPMGIVFTSGSTGTPKGVLYTHGNGGAVIQIMKDFLNVGSDDICLACHPAFALHFAGMGATVIIPDVDPRVPAQANAAGLLDVIHTQKPTVAFMQLSILRNLWRYCADHEEKIPHLKKILTTGSSVSGDLVRGLHAVFAQPDADLYVMYGATEALSICYARGRDILASDLSESLPAKGTYLGRPTHPMQVQIIPITDQPIAHWQADLALPSGQIGEICVSGPVVTPEYVSRPEATRRAKIADAVGLWHRTGDAGYVDGNGGLWYCGRIADRVDTMQGPLYTDLVEPIFNRHLRVHRSALIGLPLDYSSKQRPALVVEGDSADHDQSLQEAQLAEELKVLARQHSHTRGIEEILFYRGKFPVDVRHNAKIRRDLLTDYAVQQMQRHTQPSDALRTLQFRDYRVAYCDRGTGQPILFLHNAGNDHHIWDYQLAYFSQKYRVIAVDSLGYGQSDTPRIDYNLPLYTDMVATIVNTLALAPVIIVGTCTGASMALNYTLQHPENVRRLLLFHIATKNTVLGGNIEYNCRVLSGRPVLTRLLSPLAEALMSRRLLQKSIVRGQYGTHNEQNPTFIEHLHRLYSKRGQTTCLLNLFSNWESFASLDQMTYPQDFPPLHVFWGESNKVLPVARGQEICTKLCPQTLDIIENGGHLVMREKPELINRKIDTLII